MSFVQRLGGDLAGIPTTTSHLQQLTFSEVSPLTSDDSQHHPANVETTQVMGFQNQFTPRFTETP